MSQRLLKAIDGYISGKTKQQAMLDAGYSETTAHGKHSAIFGREDVKAEIARRQKMVATRTDINLERLNNILVSIAEANPGELITTDEAGNMFVDYSKLTPQMKKVISGFTVDDMTEGRAGEDQQRFRRLKLQFVDRLRAIEMLIRFNGLSKEKIHVEVEGDLVQRLQRGRNRVGVGEE
jgi:phage terminase small subunit